jgi:hypothetical protein
MAAGGDHAAEPMDSPLTTSGTVTSGPSLSRAATHVLFGVGGTIASTVYGTVVVMATLTAAYASEKDPWKLTTTVVAAVLVLWLAHVYAHALSATLNESDRSLAMVGGIARREIGIVLAAVLPSAMLVLGSLGVVDEHRAVWYALMIGLVTLATEGVRYARLERFGPSRTILAAAVNIGLGLFVVALKIFVAH